ncbi:MAG: hypothetical protein WD646_04435 [Actinomycetota bacterium]
MSEDFDPARLIDALQGNAVTFVVIGGIAVAGHGAPRVTLDLDICYAHNADNLKNLAAALRELNARLRGAPADVPFLLDDRTLAAGDHFTFSTDAGDLDVMATPAGTKGYGELAVNADRAELMGRTFLIASVEDLIRMKRVAGRQKDSDALFYLEAIRDELEGR